MIVKTSASTLRRGDRIYAGTVTGAPVGVNAYAKNRSAYDRSHVTVIVDGKVITLHRNTILTVTR